MNPDWKVSILRGQVRGQIMRMRGQSWAMCAVVRLIMYVCNGEAGSCAARCQIRGGSCAGQNLRAQGKLSSLEVNVDNCGLFRSSKAFTLTCYASNSWHMQFFYEFSCAKSENLKCNARHVLQQKFYFEGVKFVRN